MNSTVKHQQATLQRRDAIKALALLTGGALLSCTPLSAGLGINPSPGEDNKSTLKAFVETVVPGIPENNERMVRHFYTSDYPLAKYRNLFTKDLTRRSRRMFKAESFSDLDPVQRAEVVRDGLNSNFIVSRLYTGAVFLTQIFIYTGLYNNDHGCPMIDFPGQYKFQVTSYKNPDDFLGKTITKDGNPS